MKTFPLYLIQLPFKVRLSIVAATFPISTVLYWIIFPATKNGTVLVVPVALAAWMLGLQWTWVWIELTVIATIVVNSLLFKTLYWPQDIVTITSIGLLALVFIGLLIASLRYMMDAIVTARLKAQETEQAYEQEHLLNELKDQFILNVSHELRTPLTVIIGYLELLKEHQETLDSTLQATFLAKAVDNCNELEQLITTILDATLKNAGSQPAHIERLSVIQAIQEVVKAFPQHKIHNYPIRLELAEQIMVWADQQYFQQVVRNLLSNAFKYCPQHTPIAISATLSEHPRDSIGTLPHVCISVKDAGPGIPPDEHSQLFQKFTRLKRDLGGIIPGTGLGLYISKQLVESMGGRIWVESSGLSGEGSCFYFTLPSAPSDSNSNSVEGQPNNSAPIAVNQS